MDKRRKIGFVQITSLVPESPHIAVIEVDAGTGFSTELKRAVDNGENPARALLFLADLAARHLHPHHGICLNSHEREMWEKYFGVKAQKPPARVRKLTVVKK